MMSMTRIDAMVEESYFMRVVPRDIYTVRYYGIIVYDCGVVGGMG